MIKPYYKHLHTAKYVEVEEYGVINLDELPITVDQEQPGLYQIEFLNSTIDGKLVKMLCEHGGSNGINYGGRTLGVVREIE